MQTRSQTILLLRESCQLVE